MNESLGAEERITGEMISAGRRVLFLEYAGFIDPAEHDISHLLTRLYQAMRQADKRCPDLGFGGS